MSAPARTLRHRRHRRRHRRPGTAMALTGSTRRLGGRARGGGRLAAHQTGHNSGVVHSGCTTSPARSRPALRRGPRGALPLCAEHGIATGLRQGRARQCTSASGPGSRSWSAAAAATGSGPAPPRAGGDPRAEPTPGASPGCSPDTGIVDTPPSPSLRGPRARGRRRGRRRAGSAACGTAPRVPTAVRCSRRRGVLRCGALVKLRGPPVDASRLFGRRARRAHRPLPRRVLRPRPGSGTWCATCSTRCPTRAFSPSSACIFTRRVHAGSRRPNAVLRAQARGLTAARTSRRATPPNCSRTRLLAHGAAHWRMGLGESWRSTSRAGLRRGAAAPRPGDPARGRDARGRGRAAQALRARRKLSTTSHRRGRAHGSTC